MITAHLAQATPIYEGLGIILSIENISFLAIEEGLHNRAKEAGLKECQKCGFCCLKRPCIPFPDEIPIIANYLGVTPSELARQHMVIDDKYGIYYLLWAVETQLDIVGSFLPYYRTYDRGYCHFFDRDTHLCKIYPVRPKEARLTTCCRVRKSRFTPITRWGLEAIQRFLPEFTGEEEAKNEAI